MNSNKRYFSSLYLDIVKDPIYPLMTKMAEYFDMDVQATRFNWYRDSSEWKPFHHDAAAIKEKFARTQNFTLAASFGAERDAAFEHAKVNNGNKANVCFGKKCFDFDFYKKRQVL